MVSGDDIEVSIWTAVEPAVAVVCACLPTLRPLLRIICPLLHNLGFSSRCQGSRKRHAYGIQLGSGGAAAQSGIVSETSDWMNDMTIRQPANAVIISAENPDGKTTQDPERDDMVLSGINVQHEVSVVRAGL